MLNAISLFVAIFYSFMTVLSILGADDYKDILVTLIVLVPPALLGLATFLRF
jgi:ABC-type Fe3+ transport system permease subunit